MDRITEKYTDGTPFIPNEKIQRLGMETIARKLSDYEDKEEKGELVKIPCKIGDTVYVIDTDEKKNLKIYEGNWTQVILVQSATDFSFNVHGQISYEIYDMFYNDGRLMQHILYVGQDDFKIGERVFFKKEDALKKLGELS